jgi:hypothetical protein
MKQLINVIIGVILLSSIASAQKIKGDSVPATVKQACMEKFPLAKKIEWKLKSDKNYEAEFMQNGVELAVKFSPEGKWVETESGIKAVEVPAAVKNTITKDFPDYKVIERQKIESPGTAELIYEIHIKRNKEVVKLQYSAAGKELSRSSKIAK